MNVRLWEVFAELTRQVVSCHDRTCFAIQRHCNVLTVSKIECLAASKLLGRHAGTEKVPKIVA